MTAGISRGIRNNNPGNIRKSKDAWIGLSDVQKDTEFFTFTTPVYGIRALARLLIVYHDKHGIDTVEGIIKRWAPHDGIDSQGNSYNNHTDQYIKYVSDSVGVKPFTKIDIFEYETLNRLVRAIIFFENSAMPYSDEQIDQALLKAGVQKETSINVITTDNQQKKRDTLQKVGMGSLGLGALAEATTYFSQIQQNLSEIKFGIILLLLVALGVFAYLHYGEIKSYIKAKFDL